MSKAKGKEPEAEHNFQIRPPFAHKFKPGAVKVLYTNKMDSVLLFHFFLQGKSHKMNFCV